MERKSGDLKTKELLYFESLSTNVGDFNILMIHKSLKENNSMSFVNKGHCANQFETNRVIIRILKNDYHAEISRLNVYHKEFP